MRFGNLSVTTSPKRSLQRGLQRRVDIALAAPYIQSVGRESGNGEKGTRQSAS